MKLIDRKNLFEPQLSAQLATSLKVSGYHRKPRHINVPGSKSITNRVIVLATLAGHPLEIVAPLLADDTWWGLWALENLGFQLDASQLPHSIIVEPPRGSVDLKSLDIFVGQAGTLARFLPSVLLNWTRIYPEWNISTFNLTADPQLQRRPLTPLVMALKSLGGQLEGDALPLRIRPSVLEGFCEIDGSVSGQFLSGLLLASAGSRRPCVIHRKNGLVQPDYIRMTIAMLKVFGAEIKYDDHLEHFSIFSRELRGPPSYTVEADASTACYFAALACVLGFELKIQNLGSKTLQPDFQFMGLLRKFGFSVIWDESTCSVLEEKCVSSMPSGHILELDLSACSDQAVSVGVLALCTGIGVRVSGVAHIRHHESDRISSFCSNCRDLGVEVQEFSDGFLVPNGIDVNALHGEWKTHGDHRFALAGIVLAARARGVTVLDAHCISKTAPGFIHQLKQMGFVFT